MILSQIDHSLVSRLRHHCSGLIYALNKQLTSGTVGGNENETKNDRRLRRRKALVVFTSLDTSRNRISPKLSIGLRYKTIGILGGMGPEATAELYFRIIRLFQQEYGARYDSDFPEMIIVNLPIPDVVENTNEQDRVKEMLINGVKKLERAGADFVVVPCNTVTYYIKEMQSAVSIPIINILQETSDTVARSRIRKVGLLGTETTIRSRIYDITLRDVQILTLEKTGQAETTRIIMNILAGKKYPEERERLLGLVQKLIDRGAEKVILGCTELPLLIKSEEDVFDTLDILTKSVVERATE